MPGQVIRAHEAFEAECAKCHKRFARSAQPALCVACHDAIARDVRDQRLHGHVAAQPCSGCHTDHVGRDARVVAVDAVTFDHARTRFPLSRPHQRVPCARCHATTGSAAVDYAQPLSRRCLACHRDSDVHQAQTAGDCQACHTDQGWSDLGRFQHDRTAFPLGSGRHRDVPCRQCHAVDHLFAVERSRCVDCHGRDGGLPAGHRVQYGADCARCHDDRGWTPRRFDHAGETGYALRGKHQRVKCAGCHADAGPYGSRSALAQAGCPGCEKENTIARVHESVVAGTCRGCHTESNCEGVRTGFATAMAAARPTGGTLRCASCHLSGSRARISAPRPNRACVNCHYRDDAQIGHAGRLGTQCESCHDEGGWKPWHG